MRTKSYFLICLLLLINQAVYAQLYKLQSNVYSYGKIEVWKNQKANFIFTNTSNQNLYFLPTRQAEDIAINFPGVAINPGESYTLQVDFFTKRVGSFSKTFDVWINLSNAPIQLTVIGEILKIDPGALTTCPRFVSENEAVTDQFMQSFTVLDVVSKQPVSQAKILLKSSKYKYSIPSTDKQGNADQKMKLGLYNIAISALNYNSYDSLVYINRNTGPLVYFLTKQQLINQQPEAVVVIHKNVIAEDTLAIKAAPVQPIVLNVPPMQDYVEGTLNSLKYKPNNLVLLVDVSGSMKDPKKLPMLKLSLKNLIKTLRPIDKVTLITYAKQANIVINPTYVNDKAMFFQAIDSLKASGLTYGAESMKLAFDLLEKNYLPEANNQLILSSDGIFEFKEMTEKDVQTLTKDMAIKAIKLSVLGFGTDVVGTRFMQKLAENGDGNFYYISAKSDIENLLIEEIKQQSFFQKGQ